MAEQKVIKYFSIKPKKKKDRIMAKALEDIMNWDFTQKTSDFKKKILDRLNRKGLI